MTKEIPDWLPNKSKQLRVDQHSNGDFEIQITEPEDVTKWFYEEKKALKFIKRFFEGKIELEASK